MHTLARGDILGGYTYAKPSSRELRPITQSLHVGNTDILGRNSSTKLPYIGAAQLRIHLPILARQPARRVTRKSHISVLKSAARRLLERGTCAPEVPVCPHEHGQLGRVVRAEPWPRRDVGKVAGIEVAECQAVCLLAEAGGLSGWTEEGGKAGLEGNGLVGSVGIVWGKGNAIFCVGTDDGRLFFFCQPSSEGEFGMDGRPTISAWRLCRARSV